MSVGELSTETSKIMMQYYYSSLDRRGLEYHMATRWERFFLSRTGSYLHPGLSNSSEIKRMQHLSQRVCREMENIVDPLAPP